MKYGEKMKTIALRFGEHFAPECGTISAHQRIIDDVGFVWYGKLGSAVSTKIVNTLMNTDDKKILLINSGKADRYWAHVIAVSYEVPPLEEFPEYYHDLAAKMKTWFKIDCFDLAEKSVMSKCVVSSSGASLSEASKHSMSPYFIIEYEEA